VLNIENKMMTKNSERLIFRFSHQKIRRSLCPEPYSKMNTGLD